MGEALEVSFTAAMLPDDVGDAILAGRLNLPQGPTPVLIRDGFVEDMSRVAADQHWSGALGQVQASRENRVANVVRQHCCCE